MKLVVPDTVSVGWFASRVGSAGMNLTVVVKGTFRLCWDAPAKYAPDPESVGGDVSFDGEGEQSLKYPSDFVLFKPKADILFLGAAHAPGGRPVAQVDAVLRVGQFKKALRIVGDRSWLRLTDQESRASEPITFTTMPIMYERAYGGIDFKPNPIGLGHDKTRLPNIESQVTLIRTQEDQPAPSGFGPIAGHWEPRNSKTGSYTENWVKERWPWFPEDFDWSYFNAAPEDQQIESYLRGDEELEFQNLHPQHPMYRSRLPGLRATAFVQIELPDTEPEFREVPLNLDTLWIDMETEKLILVWRGLTPVRSVKFKEVTHLAALTEPLESPVRSKEEMHAWMLQQIQIERGQGQPTAEEAAEEAAAKASKESFERDMAAMDQEKAKLEQEFAELEAQADKQWAQEKARLIEEGIDPKVLEQPPKPQTIDEMKAQLASQVAQLAETNPEFAAKLAGLEKELDELENMDKEFAALEAEDAPPASRETVQVAAAQGTPLVGADLSGLDLSSLDLSGADLSKSNFSGANMSGTKLVETRLDGADFSEANLSGADLSRASLHGADFSEAQLEGAKFTESFIQGASFSELQLPGADFSGCTGRHPNFSGSNLEGANFTGAKLPQADFCGANVNAATFARAELPSADFGGALAHGIDMERADLTNVRAGEKANFSGGKFREANAPKSIWEGSVLDRADFSRAILVDALFEDASVKETRFDRANLTKASFEDASAQRAVLTNANLLRVMFNRTDLTEARLDGSNLYEASFWEAMFHNTSTQDANLKRTTLA